MKGFSILLYVLTAFLYFGIIKASAQKATKAKGFITVELSVPGYDVENLKIPISLPNKIGYGIGGGMGCGECDTEQPSEFSYTAHALKLKGSKAIVNFRVIIAGMDDDKKQKIQKTFTVYYGRKTLIKLKYGISLVAYYDYKNKKAN